MKVQSEEMPSYNTTSEEKKKVTQAWQTGADCKIIIDMPPHQILAQLL